LRADPFGRRQTPPEILTRALADITEPVVIGGHAHLQLDRRAGRWRFVNVGSVGRPYEGRPGAYWALLGPDVEFVRTDYDVDAAAQAVLASGQPRAVEVAERSSAHPAPKTRASSSGCVLDEMDERRHAEHTASNGANMLRTFPWPCDTFRATN
jgi:hypothetical protein